MRLLSALFLALVLILTASSAALAHEHNEQQEAAPAGPHDHATPAQHTHSHGVEEAPPPGSIPLRALSWAGRMHPFLVHFPIVLFPVAWFALVFTRRRGEGAGFARALMIAAGLSAAVAAVAGWLTWTFAPPGEETDWVEWHQRIGTGLGLIGAVLALWLLWRPAAAARNASAAILLILTLVILVQGWLGAVVTHGFGHMAF